MKQAKTVTKLEQKLDKVYAESLKRHKLIVAARKEAKPIIEQMPDKLANRDWWQFKKLDEDKWHLETFGLSEQEADELIKELKIVGVYGIKSTYKRYSNAWAYKGSITLGGIEVEIEVDGGSTPPNCRIEETREMKEVITYKAICEETEEEL